MEKKKGSISEIAQVLELSPTTVSRALSGKGRVSEETKSKVADYIANQNIVPHRRLSGYSDKKTMNVCVTLPMGENYAELPFFTHNLMALYDYFNVRGYNIMIVKTSLDDISALKNVIRRHKVDGVILTKIGEHSSEVDYLKEHGVPFVVTGSCPDENVYQADVDQYGACRELVSLLFKMGIRRTAFLCADLRQTVMKSRLSGYLDVIRENDIPFENRWIIEDADDANVLEKAIGDILREQIECIICSDDGICRTVLNYLRGIGVRVPGDIKVASLYNSRFLEEYNAAITSVEFDIRELGRVAGGMLTRLMNGEVSKKRELLGYKILISQGNLTAAADASEDVRIMEERVNAVWNL